LVYFSKVEKQKRADYLLRYTRDFLIAVVEAKANYKTAGEPISLADDFKAAATDSIKKCASLLGVGLHLYTDNGHRSSEKPDEGRSGSGNGNNGRITAKQHKFCLDLATSKGITKNELNQKCLDAFGSVLDYIGRSEASSLISELQSK
jgi:hypothetical protein